MQQIVWNLLSNAIKFTAPGGRVEVRLERSGDFARLVVCDNGEGIPPAFKPFLFERFRPADGAATRRPCGIGMGLAIVKHLVELHGGTVDADSAGIGLGATVIVTLPIARDANRRSVPPPGVELERRAAAVSLAGVRILLVDDEFDAREL